MAACAASRRARRSRASATCCAPWPPSSARATASRSWCRSTACPTGPPRARAAASARTSPRARARSRPRACAATGAWSARWPTSVAARARRCHGGARGTSPTARSSSARSARTCSRSSAPLAPAVYTRFVRALKAELDALPGDQRLVIGELAGVPSARTYGAGIEEFVDALPDDVVCAGAVYAQHAYVKRGERAADNVIDQLEAALARRSCTQGRPIWITETGVGGPHLGDARIDRGRRPARRLPRLARRLPPLARRPARRRRLPVHLPRRPGLPGGARRCPLGAVLADVRAVAGVGRRAAPRRSVAAASRFLCDTGRAELAPSGRRSWPAWPRWRSSRSRCSSSVRQASASRPRPHRARRRRPRLRRRRP